MKRRMNEEEMHLKYARSIVLPINGMSITGLACSIHLTAMVERRVARTRASDVDR